MATFLNRVHRIEVEIGVTLIRIQDVNERFILIAVLKELCRLITNQHMNNIGWLNGSLIR